MKKKFFLKFFLFTVIATLVTFTSCKDYDDDISDLQNQITNLSGVKTDLDGLKADIAAAKASASAAQTAADAALAKANEALQAAQNAGDADAIEAAQTAADNAQTAADAAQAKADEVEAEAERLLGLIEALEGRVDALEALDSPSKADLDAISDEIADINEQVMKLFGQRLTSISLSAPSHVNGIAAINFKSLGYVPQKYNADHGTYGYTTTNVASAPKIIIDDNKSTVVDFQLNPRYIASNSIGFPYFESIVSENIKTYAVSSANAGKNTPIKPVEGQNLNITPEGILKLQVTKSVTSSIESELSGNTEKFYFASLAIPVADEYLTEDEKDNGGAVITSEQYRIHETIAAPRIKSTLAGALVTSYATDGTPDSSPVHYRPYGIDVDGKPVHYSSLPILKTTAADQLIDVLVDWKDGIDLNTLVTVCTEEDHSTFTNYADYGLTFEFALAPGTYLQGTNNTDQQKFASIDSKGVLSSKVYTIGGETKTAIGREPIIQASLMDKDGKLVDRRFIKIKFYEKPAAPKVLPPFTFKAQNVSCDNIVSRFGTQEMNELVYRKVEELFGVSKDQFHEIYTTVAIDDLKKGSTLLIENGISAGTLTHSTDGSSADVMFRMLPDLNETTSFNLEWSMSPEAVGTIVPKAKETYTLTVKFVDQSTTKVWGDIFMDFVIDVTIPTQNFAYQGTYWKNGVGEGTFNVNPIVYDPTAMGNPPAAGESHIEADLMNGYIFTGTNKKPVNMAEFIKSIGSCADVNFVFDQSRFGSYSHLAGYKASDTGLSLYKWAASTTPTDPANNNYLQADNVAATIYNQFGAVAKTTAPTNPVLGSGNDEAKAQLRLHEIDVLNGTSSAKALIGKNVPVNLEVTYNAYNTVAVQKFEVHFIDPLKVNSSITGLLPDAVIGGSFVDVKAGLTFTNWNNYKVADSPYLPTPAPVLEQYRTQLYTYYAVRDVTFDADNAKSSLKLVGSTYQHVEGENNGNLPTGNSLESVNVTDQTTVPWTFAAATTDPTHLRYVNNDGTPVNVDYSIFVDATAQYKWGQLTQPKIKIDVTKAVGTPNVIGN